MIAEAYEIMTNERCSQCGYPRWICHNDDGDIGFAIDEDTCFAKRETERVDAEKSKGKKDYKPPLGTVAQPRALRYSGGPLGIETREAYYEKAATSAEPKPETGSSLGID